MTDTTKPNVDNPAENPANVETPQEPESIAEGMMQAIEKGEEPEAMPAPNEEPKADESKSADAHPADDADKPNAELEAEMDSLGLKERSRTRFQALTRENNELRPLKAALEAAGLKDMADVPALIARAEAGTVFEEAIRATGAPPSDFAQALDILADLNSGDIARQTRGFDALNNVVKQWSPLLGKPIEIVDLLEGHPDLANAVDSGEITKAHALELAQNRSQKRLQEARAQQVTQQTEQAEQYEQVEQEARQRLTALGNELASKDPHYQAKYPALKAALISIMENTPPDRWEMAAYRAYQNIPNPVAPAQAPATARPLRPVPVRENIVPEFTDPLAALRAGIAAANGEVA
jgi:hypothetical protein